jgi:hypothetical protein
VGRGGARPLATEARLLVERHRFTGIAALLDALAVE